MCADPVLTCDNDDVFASTSLHHAMPREFAYRCAREPILVAIFHLVVIRVSKWSALNSIIQTILLAIKDIQFLQNAKSSANQLKHHVFAAMN